MPVGRTVWYCDICDVDICSSCMGYGENPYGHAARARALPEVCIAADRAHRAAQDAATLAPLSLLEHPPFREKSLHVSNEWLTNKFPSMVVRVLDAHFTPNRSHVQRRICVESRRDGEEVDLGDFTSSHAWEICRLAYTPAREHESPASQRRRSMRFRRREEQARRYIVLLVAAAVAVALAAQPISLHALLAGRRDTSEQTLECR